MSRLLILFSALCVIVISSCKHDPIVVEPRICSPDSTYFVQDVLPIFQSSCAIPGCHDAETAEEGIVLDSYANIMDSDEIEPFDLDEGKLFELINESDPDDRMPPEDLLPLTSNQIDVIESWIMQGALNNSCEALDWDTENVSYSETISPIIENHCRGCHNGSNANGDIELVTYEDISELALADVLIGVLTNEGGYTAMPINSFPLAQCKIDQIQQWIDDGAPNN